MYGCNRRCDWIDWKKEEKPVCECESSKMEEVAPKEEEKPHVIFLLGGPGSGRKYILLV